LVFFNLRGVLRLVCLVLCRAMEVLDALAFNE
jgi:hypothetical protein